MAISTIFDDSTRHFVRLRELGFSSEQAKGLVEIRKELIEERRTLWKTLRRALEHIENSFRRPRYLPAILCGTLLAAAVTIIAELVTL